MTHVQVRWAILVLALMPLTAVRAVGQPTEEAASVSWDLGDLYASVEAWSAAYVKTRAQAEQLDRFKGSLGKDASDMLKALSAISDAQLQAARLGV
jgi:oligoendopeptidase F